MKKPEDQEPKDITEEDELTEAETDEVSGGAITADPAALNIKEPTTVFAGTCNCKKGTGSTADWKAVS